MAIIGLTKSGKSVLSKQLSHHLGLVRVKVSHLIREASQNTFSKQSSQIVNDCLRQGQAIPNTLILSLISQRVQQSDCVKSGFVLDGFPETMEQADLLTQSGVILDCVFHIHQSVQAILAQSRLRADGLLATSVQKTKEAVSAIKALQEEESVKKAVDTQPLLLAEAIRIKQGLNPHILTLRLAHQQSVL